MAAGALLACASSFAGSFSVNPVRIYMGRERATAVTVVNEGDDELVMQADIFAWGQKPDGTDALVPTEDLILAPPILKLAPRSRQVLRLANLRPVMPGMQKTYRMIVREVPEAKPPTPGVQVQVALAFSLPIFITPPGVHSELSCTASRASATATAVACENRGSAYAQAVSMELVSPAGEVLASRDIGAGYILPGTRRSFEIEHAGKPLPAGSFKVTVTQDDGSKRTFDVQLTE